MTDVRSQQQYCDLSEDQHRHIVTHDLVLRFFDPKINGFLGVIVDHLYVKFAAPRCSI